MATSIEEIKFTAQDAKRTADAAYDLAKSVANHLASIGQNIEAMRLENSQQHRENGAIVREGFKEVHTRISTVKSTLDQNIRSVSVQLADLEKTIVTKASGLQFDIQAARNEAKEGDTTVSTEVQTKAFSATWKILIFLLILIAGLITLLTHGKLDFLG